MPLEYEIVLYKTDAELHGRVLPSESDFSHAVTIIHDTINRQATAIEYSSHGVEVNMGRHRLCSARRSVQEGVWYWDGELKVAGVVIEAGLLPHETTLDSILNKAKDGEWNQNNFKSKPDHNCLAFARSITTWACKKRNQEDGADLVFPFTKRFHSDSAVMTSQQVAVDLPVPRPPAEAHGGLVAGLLNTALALHPTLHAKQDIIAFIFKGSNLSTDAINWLLPDVSHSTIEQGMAKANASVDCPLELETKRHEESRDSVRSWEREYFKESMTRFFSQPKSGSVDGKKSKTSNLRTTLSPLALWVKYIEIIPVMLARAEQANTIAGKPIHTHLSSLPRHYEFFHEKLLSMIKYRQEHNAKQCHYCDSYAQATSDLEKLEAMKAQLTNQEYSLKLEDINIRIATGKHHQERWYRQNGFISNLRFNPAVGQCLIQTDYYSFYTYRKKINVLAMVLRYLDKKNALLTIEHLHYLSSHPHDFYFTAVAFQHAFSRDGNILSNELGPKFKHVVITGDTAMFNSGSLWCLQQIAKAAQFETVEIIPLCTKHGSNECDGDAGRIKPMAEQMVVDRTFPERNPALFCATIVERCNARTRAFPLFSVIGRKKAEIDAMLPGNDIKNIWKLSRGFGQIMLTGTAQYTLWCRTDVGINEPWRLEKGMGYPLPPNTSAPSWLFVDLASNPKTLCLPCSALELKPVEKGHARCKFDEYTKFNKCGFCGKRKGHNATRCPDNDNREPTLSELKHRCRMLNLPLAGKKAELQNRLKEHINDEVPEVGLADIALLDEEEDVSDVEELSDEIENDFEIYGE